MDDLEQQWRRKGATMSDKSARTELGLTQDEIVEAIRTGKLHHRVASMHGNPWIRLLRSEVEQLVREHRGDSYLQQRQAATELARVDASLRRLRSELAALEKRRAALTALLGGRGASRTTSTPQQARSDQIDVTRQEEPFDE